jgi:hypothetical protein
LARGEKFFTKTGGLVTNPSSWDATKLQSEALKAFAHQSHRNRLYLFPDRNGLAIEESSKLQIQDSTDTGAPSAVVPRYVSAVSAISCMLWAITAPPVSFTKR